MKTKIGTKEQPLTLKTPPLTSEYTMHVDEKDGKEVLVCTVGKTVLFYNIACLNDLHTMLKAHGDWMELGSADEQKSAKDGTVEAWGRSSCWRLVRTQKRTSRSFRNVYSAIDGSIGIGGSNT